MTSSLCSFPLHDNEHDAFFSYRRKLQDDTNSIHSFQASYGSTDPTCFGNHGLPYLDWGVLSDLEAEEREYELKKNLLILPKSPSTPQRRNNCIKYESYDTTIQFHDDSFDSTDVHNFDDDLPYVDSEILSVLEAKEREYEDIMKARQVLSTPSSYILSAQ
jgi:hypothetical protein